MDRHCPEQEMKNEKQQEPRPWTIDQRNQQILRLRCHAQHQIANDHDAERRTRDPEQQRKLMDATPQAGEGTGLAAVKKAI
jgi:hypothetical protein